MLTVPDTVAPFAGEVIATSELGVAVGVGVDEPVAVGVGVGAPLPIKTVLAIDGTPDELIRNIM